MFPHRPAAAASLITALLTPTFSAGAQQLCGDPAPRDLWTAAERSSWQETSSSQDVRALLQRIHRAHPKAFALSEIGTSLRGRPIQLATVLRDAPGSFDKRLRAVIIANIHGGEVEGKEAVQVILREIALGGHADILAHCDLWFVPIYNVDGNDEMQEGNRGSQNGPDAVGMRRNTQDLDLNRDVVKAETSETRALLGLFRRVDPHFFMDLHTTNGSAHGYHLTYAPALTTNMDPALDDFMHGDLVPKIRAAVLKNHGFRIFDYGNFGRGRGDPSRWTTYAHTPRYAINYFGLRNRLSLLSEAYSYLPFKERALVTRAFVLESLRELCRQKDKVLGLCAEADRRVLAEKMSFGYDSQLREPVRGKILVGSTTREGSRQIAGKEFRPVEMDIQVRFEAGAHVAYPAAWALVGTDDAVRKTLLIHGVEVHELQAEVEVEGESFAISARNRARVRYEGHALVNLRGGLVAGKTTLPKGTLIVPARQPAARIAAQLLEGHSEDSLATWNFFDRNITGADGREGSYPVVRVLKLPAWRTERVVMREGDATVDAAYQPAPARVPADTIHITMVCTRPGRRVGRRGGYESGVTWEDREVVYGIGPQKFTDLASLKDAVRDLVKNPTTEATPYLLKPGNAITNAELNQVAETLKDAGARTIYLMREPE